MPDTLLRWHQQLIAQKWTFQATNFARSRVRKPTLNALGSSGAKRMNSVAPCIGEFIRQAKEQPESLQPPGAYVLRRK